MSRLSGDDLPGLYIQSRKHQMVLLLLDEMNLARIEYHFSDFLSRLEQQPRTEGRGWAASARSLIDYRRW
jgi:5-methylcytosine-specific restriction endonuclease McrBC GTP-binding regulatory subunit McrB